MSLLKVPNFRICPYHNHFCEQCNAPTCSECNRNSHKNHKAVPFVQKSQDLIERLQLFISHCSERDKEIKRRYSVLDKCHQDIETSTASAVEQMDGKHKFVWAELDRVYNEELDSIYKLKREEQLKLQTEISQLEMIEKYHRHAEENALGLLTETGSFDFSDRCDTFLTYNPLKSIPDDRQKVWKRLLYRHPSYSRTIDLEDFRAYVKNHILGYFSPQAEQQTIEKGISIESASTALCEIRKYGSFPGSLHSLSSLSGSSIAQAKSISTCSYCNQSSHKNHNTDSLAKKSKDLTERLRPVFTTYYEQEHEMEKRWTFLNKCLQDIDDKAAKAIRQMGKECKQIIAEIRRVYQRQVDIINKMKAKDELKFETEKDKLQNLNEHRKHFEEANRQLLEHTTSPDFISRCDTLLCKSRLNNLLDSRQKLYKRGLQRLSLYKQALDPEQFRGELKKHILGYFSSERPMQLSSNISDSSLGKLKWQGSLALSIQSFYSTGASSSATAWSGASRFSYLSQVSAVSTEYPEYISSQPTRKAIPELVSYLNLEKFEGSHLKTFSNAFFSGHSMWICGWQKGGFFAKPDTVLLKVEVPDYKTIMKQKKGDPRAELPTVMIPFSDFILFAKKATNDIYRFKPETKRFKRAFSSADLSLAAMCASNDRVFILDRKHPNYIKVLDSGFQTEGKIPTGLDDVRGCEVDISVISEQQRSVPSTPSSSSNRMSSQTECKYFSCVSSSDLHRSPSSHVIHTTDYTLVISTSTPISSLRAVNKMEGVVWQLDSKTNPELGSGFNPCSVSAAETGDIYFADASTEKVGFSISFLIPYISIKNRLNLL